MIVQVTVDLGAAQERDMSRGQERRYHQWWTKVQVEGGAQNDHVRDGSGCSMIFMKADVTRPFCVGFAIVDEGNRVMFGPVESYVENEIR